MDPIATSFIVFFALFLGGFLILVCLGCMVHCCCAVDMTTYHPELTDEAIICERLTKKERVVVIEKMFENYDTNVSSFDLGSTTTNSIIVHELLFFRLSDSNL